MTMTFGDDGKGSTPDLGYSRNQFSTKTRFPLQLHSRMTDQKRVCRLRVAWMTRRRFNLAWSGMAQGRCDRSLGWMEEDGIMFKMCFGYMSIRSLMIYMYSFCIDYEDGYLFVKTCRT